MIELRSGDLLQAEAEALVNPVNCVGVMGKGLALQFKRAFPDNFRASQTLVVMASFSRVVCSLFRSRVPRQLDTSSISQPSDTGESHRGRRTLLSASRNSSRKSRHGASSHWQHPPWVAATA